MGNVEIPNWLKGLPLAPEFRPTDTEFADPIAYISKIEKEASAFGICKIIPPLPKPSKKYVFCNLNKSLSKCPDLGIDVNSLNVCSSSKMGAGDSGGSDGEVRAVFTTRHQELGQSGKRVKGGAVNNSTQLGVHKQVWQSGEIYTLEQFESKSKGFARSLLGMIKEVSPLVIEALFWKAASEKPINVEYANDVPGSAFGEPDGQFRYFHRRRRRRRMSYRRSNESSDCKKNEMDSVRNSHDNENIGTSVNNDQNTCLETPKSTATSSTLSQDEISRLSRRKSVNASNDMEGTAGWKLSNSPWNLQVIARSPGSLTRFMPDDIPGVTSPMVYIGMLFSWFAWHVEDHELHSMNFLHTGSPKTWYAVPGDYAFAFEEVIRTDAYGGNIDRLAALTMLGEKTTLLSPEIVVASGLPCCRLLQNPGEFVVTFPRAYHVGFSHGFNCGEAANFGTPQWLKVAKEAAMRRAAMNYLPMLSHQQLLYLLTMSFVSRVPRSLLPGARSSRLRDRQKEERELLVKKAFIEDMVNENSKLSVLLGRESTYHTVLWHPDLLPYPSKESQLPSITATVATTPTEDTSHCHSENDKNQNNLFDEMSLYMETLNDLYMDEDDLSCDFQIDSGTLACVACGILGFPFMSVIQPSERASKDLLPEDHVIVQERPGVSGPEHIHPSSDLDGTVKGSISVDPLPVPDLSLPPNDVPLTSKTMFEKEWNTSSKFFRPRIFCLEHALQIEELLRSKGGSNILVICHSDYQKIKAHATAVADEIGSPFNYHEVPLDSASQEDLNLIELAIDDEEHDECGEDWTSKLGINLRYCVKVRKNSPSMQVQYAFTLGGLLSDESPSSNFLNIKWQFRRCRSKIKLNHHACRRPCENIEIKKDEVVGEKFDFNIVRKEEKLIQYSRRKYKLKPNCSTGAGWVWGHPRKHLPEEAPAASCEDLDKHNRKSPADNLCNIGSTESDSSGLGFSASIGLSERLHEVQVIDATKDMSLNSSHSQAAGELATASVMVVSVVGQIKNQTSEDVDMESKACNLPTCNSSEMQHKIEAADRTSEKNKISCAEGGSKPHIIATDERFQMQRDDQVVEDMNITNGACTPVSEGQHEVLPHRGFLVNEISDIDNPASSPGAHLPVESSDEQMENAVVETSHMKTEVCDRVTSENEMQPEIHATGRSNDDKSISCDDTLIRHPAIVLWGMESKACNLATCNSSEMQHKIEAADGTSEKNKISCAEGASNVHVIATDERFQMQREDQVVEDMDITNGACTLVSEGQHGVLAHRGVLVNEIPDIANPASSHVAHPPMESFDEQMENAVVETSHMESEVCDHVTSENEVQPEIHATGRSDDDKSISCDDTLVRHPTPTSMEESCEGSTQICAAENFCNGVSLEDKMQQECKITSGSNEETDRVQKELKITSRSNENSGRLINQPSPVSMGESSKDLGVPSAAENLQTELHPQEIQISSGSKEELVSSFATHMEVDQPTPVTVEECSEVPRGTGADEDLCTSMTLDTEVQELQSKIGTNVEERVSSSVTQMEESQPIPVSVESCSEFPEGTCAGKNLSGDLTRENEVQDENQSKNASGEEELALSNVTLINQLTPAPIQKCSKTQRLICATEENLRDGSEGCFSPDNKELEGIKSSMLDARSNAGKKRKRKSELEQITENELNCNSFIKSPCEGLRPRSGKDATSRVDVSRTAEEKSVTKKVRKPSDVSVPRKDKKKIKESHKCDLEGCRMSFETKEELRLHKRNRCPHEGCGKKFRSHKYAMLHQRVHEDDRPLKCPWKGCSMSFKWAWARTEHIRVHTGERPYKCKVEGCGLSFRFVSDFSRHRRKTGHYVNSPA